MSFIQRHALRYCVVAAVGGLFALVFAAGLNAQYYTTFRYQLRSITERSRWNMGPVWIDPTLQFSLDYDSSIYGTYGGRAAVPDYVGTVGVPVSFNLILRDRLILTFTDTPEYLHFFERGSESSFNNSYSLGARLLLFRRLVLSGSHAYERSKHRVSSEIESRIFEQVQANSGSLFFETPRGSAVGLTGSTLHYQYQNDLLPEASSTTSTVLNRKENNVRFEIYRPAGPESSYFMNVGYTDYAFDYPQTRNRDSYSYQANAGLRLPLLGRARGLLSLGYKFFRPRDEQREKFSGLVGNTSLDYRFGRFGLRFQLVRDVFFSYYTDNLYFIDSRLGAGLSFYFLRNIRLGYDFSAGWGDYVGTFLVRLADGSSQEIERKDRYFRHVGSLVYRIQRNTGVGLRVDYFRRDSNNFYYDDQDRWSAGVFLVYDF